jgi:hypothetical protein
LRLYYFTLWFKENFWACFGKKIFYFVWGGVGLKNLGIYQPFIIPYNKIPAATEALSDETFPTSGIFRTWSHFS